MATFPPIQFKRSQEAGKVPLTTDILSGELALNIADGVIYTKNDSDVIITFGLPTGYDSDLRHDVDSDMLKLKPVISELTSQTFTATKNQTVFTLTLPAFGDVGFSRNGYTIDSTAYADSDVSVTYFPSLNNNQQMRSGDKVTIQYIGSAIQTETNVNVTTVVGTLDGGGA